MGILCLHLINYFNLIKKYHLKNIKVKKIKKNKDQISHYTVLRKIEIKYENTFGQQL